MKILHTSDWHIGKRLIVRERLDEQAEVLDEMIELCEKEQVELVLVAGDIFDTYIPSAEAEELFYKKIRRFADGKRAVVLISGNHDDGVRLCAAKPLSDELGIYVVGNDRSPLPTDTDFPIRPIESGKGYAVFENAKKERVFLSALPYPNEARFKEEKSELPYVEQMLAWIEESQKANEKNYPSILMAHIFVAGGVTSEGEREISVGGARAIPHEKLPKTDYVALGHLHKRQKMGKGHVYYSGAPLQYAFDEAGAEKSVQVFDLTKNGVENLQTVPLKKGRKLVRLTAMGLDDALATLKAHADELVELTIELTAPLTRAESKALNDNENLVSLRADVRTADGEIAFESRKGFSDEKMFEEFYRQQFGVLPDEKLKRTFLEILTETEGGEK